MAVEHTTLRDTGDYESVIRAVEAHRQLQYIPCAIFETPHPSVFASGLELPDLGIALRGNSGNETTYLVLEADAELEPERFELHQGGVRYEVNQLANPASIMFKPAGEYGSPCVFRGRCIIQGDLVTVSRHPDSVALYRAFAREFRKRFVPWGEFRIGPEAWDCFQSGGRLTMFAHARVMDLRLEL